MIKFWSIFLLASVSLMGCSVFFIESFQSCGDAILTSNEACDDGNTFGGDGCSATCTIEICGNGIFEFPEQCDDGNLDDTDSCRADCTLTNCGNGIVEGVEQCDDGNLDLGDGCDQNCRFEIPPTCNDGVFDATLEKCDGSDLGGQSCESLGLGGGTLVCSSLCELDTTGCENNPVCGNGRLEVGEQCDDSNIVGGDTCSEICQFIPVVTSFAPEQIELGDEDGDGQTDIFFVADRKVFVMQQQDNGSFQAPVELFSFQQSNVINIVVTVKDLDGDNRVEKLILVNRSFDFLQFSQTQVLLRSGTINIDFSLREIARSFQVVRFAQDILLYTQQPISVLGGAKGVRVEIHSVFKGSVSFSSRVADIVLTNIEGVGILSGDYFSNNGSEDLLFLNLANGGVFDDTIVVDGFTHENIDGQINAVLADPLNNTININPEYQAQQVIGVSIDETMRGNVKNIFSRAGKELAVVLQLNNTNEFRVLVFSEAQTSAVATATSTGLSSVDFAVADTNNSGLAKLFLIGGENLFQMTEAAADTFSAPVSIPSVCGVGIPIRTVVGGEISTTKSGDEVVVGCNDNKIVVF